MTLADVQDLTADCMDKIKACFKPGVKITVLVRAPGFPDCDFCMTDDEPDEIIAMMTRRKEQGEDK